MIVRIRFSRGGRAGRPFTRRRFAVGVAAMLSPAAALVGVVGLWGVAADLNLAGGFAISGGFFSHWQVWLALAALLQGAASLLNRYAKHNEPAAP